MVCGGEWFLMFDHTGWEWLVDGYLLVKSLELMIYSGYLCLTNGGYLMPNIGS